MYCMPVGVTVLSCWAENCSLENWHHEDDINEHGEIAYDRIKFRWLLVWLWFMLLSIKSLQFLFWFQLLVMFLLLVFICYLKKKKSRPLPFGILATPSFLLANFSVIVFCMLPPAAFLDCGQGSEEPQGVFFPLLGALATTKSLQGPCRKALPDPEVSSIPPSGPLPQLLYGKTGERSKSRLCKTGCLVHREGDGKIKTHPMNCCIWSSVLCRCLQGRW